MQCLHTLSGNVVDVVSRTIRAATIYVENGTISDIVPSNEQYDTYILPGFIDAHIHIESSMLVPAEFGRLASVHGTIATVSDPHEIANVLGIEGVRYMIDNARQTPLKIYFGASPCVPATNFETAGAILSPADIDQLFAQYDLHYLSEVMNYPGVLNADPDIYEKIAIAKRYGKVIDGHAPGLRGEAARQYIAAGISTDHECFTLDEALDKLSYGMKIIIREGSAAKNFEALAPLFTQYADRLMLGSDDKHPNDLVVSHIDELVRRALSKGYDLFDVLQAACVNPVRHYDLSVGLLQIGDPADCIVTNRVDARMKVLQTYINGNLVAENGKTLLAYSDATAPNQFCTSPKTERDFCLYPPAHSTHANVIEALEGQLITRCQTMPFATNAQGEAIADVERDMLKIAVVNRYADVPPAVGFIRNFGLQQGAMASSVAHDSHNIIAVGTNDEALCRAVNALIQYGGGLAAVADNGSEQVLPLPVAGLMSTSNGYQLAQQYEQIDHFVKQLGSPLTAPYMTLSFMALLVIPSLKLSDKGLFDGDTFAFKLLFCPTTPQ